MATLVELMKHRQEIVESSQDQVGNMTKDQLLAEVCDLIEFMLHPEEYPQEETSELTEDPGTLAVPMGKIDPNAALLMDGQYAGLM